MSNDAIDVLFRDFIFFFDKCNLNVFFTRYLKILSNNHRQSSQSTKQRVFFFHFREQTKICLYAVQLVYWLLSCLTTQIIVYYIFYIYSFVNRVHPA